MGPGLVVGVEGAEVVEGSQDIRMEAGKCPERAYFVGAVCTDLCGLTENPGRESCERGSL
jgi:hypothetical protein